MQRSIRAPLIAAALMFAIQLPGAAEIASPPSTPPGSAVPSVPAAVLPEEFELKPRAVAFIMDKGKWDDAETLFDEAFKSIYAALARRNLHPAGPPMVEYLDSDDTAFSFRAIVPVDAAAGTVFGQPVQFGTGPAGKVLKFVHHGSFDELEGVYNRIDDYLAAKNLTMSRIVEEYVTDQTVTPPDELVTNIYVFVE